ncbi:MAG TPA: glycoside hydrolase family 172 protein [Fimbriimonas sp.]|nr:glycoside hydrolase family 172 protein [Fimbriimonas sp.]
MPELHRLDLLPAFKRSISIGAVTSYDRTGGNDDGFSGKYSFVRKEGDSLVLADLRGPGCIYRIHTPTPTDDPLEFYFDGESTPRISLTFNKLYSGEIAPFVRPLVQHAGGGCVSYVPIPYEKSCKIVLRAKSFQFYDLNYASYPAGAPVKTFSQPQDQSDIQAATRVFNGGRSSDLTAYNVPAGTHLSRHSFNTSLQGGKAVTLFETHNGGRIASLRLGPAEALEGKARDIMLRVTWDGANTPAILCPAGDFFGYGWGKPAMGSCLLGTNAGVDYCNLPMPFDHSAKIELVSLRDGAPITVKGEVVVGDSRRRSDEGKFYAVWRRENPTTQGKPYTYLDTKGRGHLVGLALQAQGSRPGNTEFFEGDDVTTIDGQMAVHGTGSEDSFNGGWYDVPDRWDAPVALPLSGCMLYEKPIARTGAYRFFVTDAYPFRKSILQTIEHGPEGNREVTDYCSVAYLYSENPPTERFEIPSAAARAVHDPSEIVFSAHWTLPISSFTFTDGTISRHPVNAGDHNEQCLSLRAKGEDWVGPPFVQFVCDLPAAGRYEVYIDAVKGPEGAEVQLFSQESPIGSPADLFSDKPARVDRIPLGEVSALEGANKVMLKLVGKNRLATAFGLDLINVVFKKL